MSRELNDRQRKAIQGVAAGMSHKEAGVKAGYSAKTSEQHVSRLLSNVKSKAYLAELRENAAKKAEKATVGHVLTIMERKAMLTRISSTNEDEDPNASRQAIAELNKMDGAYEPEKVSHTHSFFENTPKDNGLGRS